jgi:hypothetical protein
MVEKTNPIEVRQPKLPVRSIHLHTGLCPSVGISATFRSTGASLFGLSGAPMVALRCDLPFAFEERGGRGAVGRSLFDLTGANSTSSNSKSASGSSSSSSSELTSLYEILCFP